MSEVEELRAEVEQWREAHSEVCSVAQKRLARAEAAEAELRSAVAEVEALRSRLRKVEALADEWERHSLILLSAGTGVSMIAHADAVQRIRAVLAAEPAEDRWTREFCGHPSHGRYGHVCEPAEVTPPAGQRHPSLCICTDCDAADAAKRTEGGASAGGADNECSCAMTEASQRTCPLHGEDDWRADTSEQGGEPR